MKFPIMSKQPIAELIEKYGSVECIPKDEFIFFDFKLSPAKIKKIGTKGKGMSTMTDLLFIHYKKLGYEVCHLNDNINQNITVWKKPIIKNS